MLANLPIKVASCRFIICKKGYSAFQVRNLPSLDRRKTTIPQSTETDQRKILTASPKILSLTKGKKTLNWLEKAIEKK
jgi:hypothetical protein